MTSDAHRTAPCDACGLRREHVLRWSISGYELFQCRSCGLIALLDVPTAEELRAIYDESYHRGTAYVDYVRDRPVLERNFRRYVEVIRAVAPRGRLLEVGAAYGFFLHAARESFEVRGVELSATAAAYARETLGLNVWTGDLQQAPLAQGSFDVAALWDTLEHVPRPSDAVRRLRELLRPGGWLFLTTPDVGSLAARARGRGWRLLYPPEHLYYFSQVSLRRLLERCGFAEVEYGYRGLWRSMDFAAGRFTQRPDWQGRILSRLFGGLKRLAPAFYVNLADIMFVRARRSA